MHTSISKNVHQWKILDAIIQSSSYHPIWVVISWGKIMCVVVPVCRFRLEIIISQHNRAAKAMSIVQHNTVGVIDKMCINY